MKHVVITGANRGIGLELARHYQAEGWRVTGVCRETSTDLAGIAAQIIEGIEVTSKESVDQLVATLKGQTIDLLINNAGVAWGSPLDDFPEHGWDKVMDVNVKGVFFLTQKLMPLLRKSASADNPARVINIASIDGMHTSPMSGYAYGTSKAAVIHLTRFMGSQLAKENILVNGIAPGPFPTYMLSTGVGFKGETEGVDWDAIGSRSPSGRVGKPEDIANCILYLASEEANYVTGAEFTVDAGMTAQ